MQIISDGVIEIMAGSGHNIVLKGNGDVYCFGENDYGQIGNGYTSTYESPYKVLSDAIHVYASPYGSYALKANGDLYRWGAIGRYTYNTSISTPTKITSNVRKVYVTDGNVFVLKNDDTIWAMGSNDDGLLGLGYNELNTCSKEFTLVFEDVHRAWPLDSKIFIQKKDGSIWALGGYIGTGSASTSTTYNPIEFLSNKTIEIESIELPTEIIIEVNQNGYLPINITPTDANHKALLWASDNDVVATVNNGIVYGVKEGETVIRVTTNDYQTDHTTQCKVKVVPQGAGIDEIIYNDIKTITVYNVKGILIYHGKTSELPKLESGIYIIKQGGKTIKLFQR